MRFVLRYERERGWQPTDISHDYDSSGFDIRSIGPADAEGIHPIRRIEVKGRALDLQDVTLTPNEWLQARRHGSTYWLYVVWGCSLEQPRLVCIQNPAEVLADGTTSLIEVKGYRVSAQAINAATRE